MKVLYYRNRASRVEIRPLRVSNPGGGKQLGLPLLSTADLIMGWIGFHRQPQLPLNLPEGGDDGK